MAHFTVEQWFEFARASKTAEQNLPMQLHLDEGCDRCYKLLTIWREVLEIGSRELRYQPPPEMLRPVRGIYVPQQRCKWFSHIAEKARLIFDSRCAPLAAGVRGSTLSLQFLQEASPFVVDVRADFEPSRKRIRLAGQVLNTVEPQTNVPDVEIFLLNGDELAANTKANASGEFEIEFEEDENLQLFVDIRGRKVIEITVPTHSDMTRN